MCDVDRMVAISAMMVDDGLIWGVLTDKIREPLGKMLIHLNKMIRASFEAFKMELAILMGKLRDAAGLVQNTA